MERLTEHHVNKSLGAYMVCSMTCDNSICRVDCREISKIVDRLAAYEDIGMEPEEIVEVQSSLEPIPFGRVHDIMEAEREERLVVLPCKVGDVVWTNFAVCGWHFRDKDRPYSAKVVFIGLNNSDEMGRGLVNVAYEKHNYMMQFSFSDIGKTVFLTREEAEAALKKEGGEIKMSIEEIANELNSLAYRLDSMRNYQATTEGLKTTKALREAATMLQSNHNEKLNAPLTLDEMLEMDGEPVWVETPEKSDDCNGLSMVKLSAPWKPGGLKPHVLIVSKNGDRNYAELLMVGFGGKIYRIKPKEEAK